MVTLASGARVHRRRFLRAAVALGAVGLADVCGWRPVSAARIDGTAVDAAEPRVVALDDPPPRPAPESAGPGNPAITNVVVIVVDGMMPEYLGLGSFPNLRSLIQRGTSFERAWVGQMINDTPVSHTTLVSGKLPRETGVVFFYWRDPRDGKILEIETPPMIEGGAFAALMREQKMPSIGRTIKQYRPGAKVAAVGSTKDFAAITLGLDSADYIGYAVRLPAEQSPGQKIDSRQVDPRGDVLPNQAGDAADDGAREVRPPVRRLAPGGPESAPLPAAILDDPRYAMTARELGDNNVFAGNLAVGLFEQVRPTVLLVNLPDTDQVGHLTGGFTINPEAVAATMATADAQIGRLLEAYARAGLGDSTLWVITSDHGMTPNGINVNPKFIEQTLGRGEHGWLAGDTVHYWLKQPSDAATAAALLDGQRAPGVFGTYFKADQGNGRFVYQPTPVAQSRLNSGQAAAFEYLLGTLAGPQSPDLTVVLGENVHFHTAPINTIGAHSEATWLLQRIPLVFNGPGVPAAGVSGYPARLVDLAPTVLALLGLPAEGMDGTVLSDVLPATTAEVAARQLSSPDAARLLSYQDALVGLTAPG